MSMPWLRTVALGILVLTTSCARNRHPIAKAKDGAVKAKAPLAPPATLASELARIQEERHIALDRRVGLALTDLARLTGAPACTVAARPSGTTIRCGNEDVAQLDELCDFGAIRAALVKVAQRGTPLTKETVDEKGGPWLLEGTAGAARARAAGERWTAGAHGVAVVVEGLRGVLALAVGEQDQLGLTDAIDARALALLAMAETVAARPLEAALTAQILGYDHAAADIATTLPEAEPARLLLVGDGAWRKVAEEPSADPVRAGLAHLSALRAGDGVLGARLRAKLPAAALTSTGVQVPRVLAARGREGIAIATLIPWLAFAELQAIETSKPVSLSAPPAEKLDELSGAQAATADWAKALAVEPVKLLKTLAANADKLSAGAGPFLEGDLLALHIGALVCAQQEGIRTAVVLDPGFAPVSDAQLENVLSSLPRRFRGGVSWLRFFMMLRRGGNPALTISDALRNDPAFAAPVVAGVLAGPLRARPWEDTFWPKAVQALGPRLDSRPAHRGLLAELARARGDVTRYDSLTRGRAAGTLAEQRFVTRWTSLRGGDPQPARAELADPSLDARAKQAVLEDLRHEGLATAQDDDRVVTAWLADDRDAQGTYQAALLLASRDPKRAIALLEKRLKLDGSARWPLTPALQTELAILRLQRGDKKGAWKALEPTLGGINDAGSGLACAASIRAAERNFTEAENFARRRLQKDRSGDAVGQLVEILLKANKPAAALDVLAKPPLPLSDSEFRLGVGPHLVAAINAEAPLREFMDRLIHGNLAASSLLSLASAYSAAGRNDLAHVFVASLPQVKGAEAAYAAAGYQYLKRARGSAAADQWLRGAKPPHAGDFARAALVPGVVDATYVVPPPSEPGADADSLWLARAAGLALRHETDGPRWTQVRDHYQKDPGKSAPSMLGRHLVGLAPLPSELLSDPKLPDRAQAAAYLGARALSEGQLGDATEWLQLAADTGDRSLPERQLAAQLLESLRASKQPVVTLAKEARWPPAQTEPDGKKRAAR